MLSRTADAVEKAGKMDRVESHMAEAIRQVRMAQEILHTVDPNRQSFFYLLMQMRHTEAEVIDVIRRG